VAVGCLGLFAIFAVLIWAANLIKNHFVNQPRDEALRVRMNDLFDGIAEEQPSEALDSASVAKLIDPARKDNITLPNHPRRLRRVLSRDELLQTLGGPQGQFHDGTTVWRAGLYTAPKLSLTAQFDGTKLRCIIRTITPSESNWEETVCSDYSSWKFERVRLEAH